MSNYVSLIIDIEKSRTYGIIERNEIQEYISKYVKGLNNVFKSSLECYVTFSGGDELQGLFDNPVAAIMYFRLLEMFMKPVKLRAGIGIGEWTIRRENRLSTQQDGPVYHRAREAIEEVYGSQFQSIRIVSESKDVWENYLINASYILKRQQVDMQNLVQVIVELIYPFITSKMDLSDSDVTIELMEIKFQAISKGIRMVERRSSLLKDREGYINEILIDPIPIDGVVEDADKILLKRNMSTVISRILGCSRQNVDSIIKRGNVNKIRELDYMALQYIEQKYGGYYGTNYFGTYFR